MEVENDPMVRQSPYLVMLVLALSGCSGDTSPHAVGADVGHSLDRASVATGNAVGRAGQATGNALDRAGNSVQRATSP
jgi:hypothetical protein